MGTDDGDPFLTVLVMRALDDRDVARSEDVSTKWADQPIRTAMVQIFESAIFFKHCEKLLSPTMTGCFILRRLKSRNCPLRRVPTPWSQQQLHREERFRLPPSVPSREDARTLNSPRGLSLWPGLQRRSRQS